jgi:hypothetical protein
MTKIKTSPKGETVYPWLSQPDTQFNTDGVYKTKLLVDGEEAKATIKIINDVIAKEIAKQHQKTPDDIKPTKKWKMVELNLISR